jgi:hypothetical protein
MQGALKMYRHLVVATFVLMLAAERCGAQTFGHVLGGLSNIELLIEKLDKDAASCGISEEAIREAFMYPVSGSKFQISSPNRFVAPVESANPTSSHIVKELANRLVPPRVYVEVTTLRLTPDNTCFSHVSMSVEHDQQVELDFSGRSSVVTIELWHQGMVEVSSVNRHAQVIKQAVEHLTKSFITDWNFDNKAN